MIAALVLALALGVGAIVGTLANCIMRRIRFRALRVTVRLGLAAASGLFAGFVFLAAALSYEPIDSEVFNSPGSIDIILSSEDSQPKETLKITVSFPKTVRKGDDYTLEEALQRENPPFPPGLLQSRVLLPETMKPRTTRLCSDSDSTSGFACWSSKSPSSELDFFWDVSATEEGLGNIVLVLPNAWDYKRWTPLM